VRHMDYCCRANGLVGQRFSMVAERGCVPGALRGDTGCMTVQFNSAVHKVRSPFPMKIL